ncbi:helix-turn-helix domain-containing protein [Spirosoma linguale]|uniref:helix-turn-helix domain-containing protein n=1 Tax=Spirosoma linguale TaxID=108 RepID=UPI003CC7F570
MKDQGWKQSKIAQALGLTEGWVSRTLTKYRQQGQAGLAWRRPSGPDCRLTDEQVVQLLAELNKGVEHHGFSGAVWTRPRVNDVIKKLFGWSATAGQL